MKKSSLIMLVCLLALVTLVGVSCTSFKISGLEVAQQASSGATVGNFDINVKITKWLGIAGGPNLLNIGADNTDPAIVNAIKGEITKLGGTKAINVKIEYQATFINLILNGILGGIYAPATAHVTGTVIK
jgi:hypothetical protein